MEFLILILIIIVFSILLGFVLSINKKKILNLAKNEKLDNISKKYPNNVELCKKYLKMLNNENVEIEENDKQEASLYIAITNKIVIANINDTFTRIQTIAHECLHSVQDRKVLLFNFIFSNIYLLYYIIICLLALLNKLPFNMMFLTIFLIMGIVKNTVRLYLENDAMLKARFLAKDYMCEEKISNGKEIEELVEAFDKLNSLGIKYMYYQFFLEIMYKAVIFIIITFL